MKKKGGQNNQLILADPHTGTDSNISNNVRLINELFRNVAHNIQLGIQPLSASEAQALKMH